MLGIVLPDLDTMINNIHSYLKTTYTSLSFPDSSIGKESTCNAGDLGSIPGWENPLEKVKATHSSILA